MKGHCVWNTVRNRERAVRISCRYRFWRSLCLFILSLGYPEKSSGKLEGKACSTRAMSTPEDKSMSRGRHRPLGITSPGGSKPRFEGHQPGTVIRGPQSPFLHVQVEVAAVFQGATHGVGCRFCCGASAWAELVASVRLSCGERALHTPHCGCGENGMLSEFQNVNS